MWAKANTALQVLLFYSFQICTELCREPTYTHKKTPQCFLNTTAARPVHGSWTHAWFYTWNQEEKQGWGGCQYWVCSGDFGSGVSVELLHTTVHAGQKRLLTDWCLVTLMVGMGELSAWPLSEPRIWIQEDRKAQGQESLLPSVSSKDWWRTLLGPRQINTSVQYFFRDDSFTQKQTAAREVQVWGLLTTPVLGHVYLI